MTAGRARWLASWVVAAFALSVAHEARGQAIYSEDFDSSFPPPEWFAVNYGTSPQTAWFGGNAGVFPAHSGPSNGYAAANFLATHEGGDVSLWLFSAPLDFQQGDVLTFFTRAENVPGSGFSDGLVVRIGRAESQDPLDYQTVVFELGPAPGANPYPTTHWAGYAVVLPENADVSGSRIAFQFVAESQDAASYVGLDSVGVHSSGADTDGDLWPDDVDNCVTVPNPGQEDGAGGLEVNLSGVFAPDGVGDACDNCVRVNNPRQISTYLASNPWRTLTGGQIDDDHDGYGNKCDAKFTGTPNQAVGGLDLAQQRSSSARDRRLDVCGTVGSRPCAIFDLDEAPTGNLIGGLDLARFRALSAVTPGPRCAACTGTGSALLPCTAGTAGSCAP